MSQNVIILKGDPILNGQKTASVLATPGMLLEDTSATQVRPHTTAGENAARLFALDQHEFGEEPIETTYPIGVIVKTGLFKGGEELKALIANGENLTGSGEPLESDGAGALQVLAADADTSELQREAIVAYSIESTGGALGAAGLFGVRVA